MTDEEEKKLTDEEIIQAIISKKNRLGKALNENMDDYNEMHNQFHKKHKNSFVPSAKERLEAITLGAIPAGVVAGGTMFTGLAPAASRGDINLPAFGLGVGLPVVGAGALGYKTRLSSYKVDHRIDKLNEMLKDKFGEHADATVSRNKPFHIAYAQSILNKEDAATDKNAYEMVDEAFNKIAKELSKKELMDIYKENPDGLMEMYQASPAPKKELFKNLVGLPAGAAVAGGLAGGALGKLSRSKIPTTAAAGVSAGLASSIASGVGTARLTVQNNRRALKNRFGDNAPEFGYTTDPRIAYAKGVAKERGL